MISLFIYVLKIAFCSWRTGKPGMLPSMGSKESDMTERPKNNNYNKLLLKKKDQKYSSLPLSLPSFPTKLFPHITSIRGGGAWEVMSSVSCIANSALRSLLIPAVLWTLAGAPLLWGLSTGIAKSTSQMLARSSKQSHQNLIISLG